MVKVIYYYNHGEKTAWVKGVVADSEESNSEDKSVFAGLCRYYLEQNSSADGAVVIPEKEPDYGYSVVRITDSCFSNSPFIRSIFVPKTIETIDWNQLNCENLESITVDPANQHYTDISGVLFSKDEKHLVAYPNKHNPHYIVPSGVLHIDHFAFKGCYDLQSIDLPNGLVETHKQHLAEQLDLFHMKASILDPFDLDYGIAIKGGIGLSKKHGLLVDCAELHNA